MNSVRWLAVALPLCLSGANTAYALDDLVREGMRVFHTETFNGNGRTCSTCHRFERNFTIDPEFIADLPANDPLFIAESNPQLAGLENSVLLRERGLFITSTDSSQPNFRSTSHLNALRTTIDSPSGPHLGWAGISHGDGSLLHFTDGAIIQHFPRTLNRQEGVDFRLATPDELAAIEAFQLFIGRQEELDLPLNLTDPVALSGQNLFLDDNRGKCNTCHLNAGANRNGAGGGNQNFNTGTAELSRTIAVETGQVMPADPGAGNGSFNTPSLVEAADTAPYFHNHGAATLRDALSFYGTSDFVNSPSGDALGTPNLDRPSRDAVIAFLVVLNAIQNLDEAHLYLGEVQIEARDPEVADLLLIMARAQVNDAIRVLESESLHSDVRRSLAGAARRLNNAESAADLSDSQIDRVRSRILSATRLMVAPGSPGPGPEPDPDPPSTGLVLTSVTPDTIRSGTDARLTLTGSGFTADTIAVVCGRLTQIRDVTFVDPNTLEVDLSVLPGTSGTCNVQLTIREPFERVRLRNAVTIIE